MRFHFALTVFLLSIISTPLTGLAQTEVNTVRMWPAPDNTRLVFDLTAPAEHNLFTLVGPDRIVIDLKQTRFRGKLPEFSYKDSFIKNIRYAHREGNELRFVLDLNNQVRPKSFVLKPHRDYGHRLVIDLFDNPHTASQPAQKPAKTYRPQRSRDVIIAIDAGHGGEDPGAIGARGTREKDVVLAIARKLEQLVRREPGMKPVMIRTGDYYVGLKQRMDRARKLNADLFISIHADAFHNRKARGTSVYVNSGTGASSEAAKFLANSENSADLIGGVSLDDKDDLLKLVLVDMVKNSTIEDSHKAARQMLKSLKGVNRLHKNKVEQAGFRVLKAPDMPSILIETAFISNPQGERKLRSRRHQMAMAKAILKGTRNYFRNNAPAGTTLASATNTPATTPTRKHRISRGDTLSSLAERYRVSVAAIKRRNQLRTNMLRVGQVLRIPVS